MPDFALPRALNQEAQKCMPQSQGTQKSRTIKRLDQVKHPREMAQGKRPRGRRSHAAPEERIDLVAEWRTCQPQYNQGSKQRLYPIQRGVSSQGQGAETSLYAGLCLLQEKGPLRTSQAHLPNLRHLTSEPRQQVFSKFNTRMDYSEWDVTMERYTEPNGKRKGRPSIRRRTRRAPTLAFKATRRQHRSAGLFSTEDGAEQSADKNTRTEEFVRFWKDAS